MAKKSPVTSGPFKPNSQCCPKMVVRWPGRQMGPINETGNPLLHIECSVLQLMNFQNIFCHFTSVWHRNMVSISCKMSTLILRSHEVSKLWDFVMKYLICFEIWEAAGQHCSRATCQISKPLDRHPPCIVCGATQDFRLWVALKSVQKSKTQLSVLYFPKQTRQNRTWNRIQLNLN